MSNYSVSLVGPAPWGFRLQGGKDFNMPLTISRLSDSGKAARANVGIGDVVLTIDGTSTEGMTHLEAQNKIKACTGNLNMNLQRVASAPKPDPVVVQKVTTVTKKNPPKRPPRKHIVDTYTEFYHTPTHSDASKKRLIEDTEDWHPRTGTTQSRSFRILAQITGTEHMKEPETESTKKTKESQTENGDLSMSAVLPNEIEAQYSSFNLNKHSVATQTVKISAASEPSSTPLPAIRPESTSFSSPLAESSAVIVPSARLSGYVVSTSPHERKLLFDNPLEALPKCAPHPPAIVQVLNISSQVATLSKVASTYIRKISQSAELSAPGPATLMTNEAGKGSSLSCKHTVATQTSEQSLLAVVSVEPPSAGQPVESVPSVPNRHDVFVPSEKTSPFDKVASSQTRSSLNHTSQSFYIKKALPENPLEDLPKFSPIPVPSSRQSSKIMSGAAATVSAAVAVRARLSDLNVYRSLLDALLITPITKPPPLQSVRPARKSTSALELKKNESDSLEASQPVAYTAASVRSMPASPGKTETSPAAANIKMGTAFKPTGSQSSVKYSGWQPSNQAAPASGWTSNNITPSGATAPSDKSVIQPPLEEQDTLVQRAEHIPAGKRTPMCAQCNQVIRGPFLVALGKSWHPEEFNCAHCRTSMAYIGFVEEKGSLYCEVCYEKFFAPECSRCQRKILGEVINALKQTWHVSCFVCVACNNPIRNNVFHLEDGDPYCETDYYALFGTMCYGCEFPIEAGDRFLEALGHTWHDTCFVCSVCCDSLEGQTFFSKKDKPLCKKHAHSMNF